MDEYAGNTTVMRDNPDVPVRLSAASPLSPHALASTWGLVLTPAQVERLDAYIALLHTWNARVNLTGARTRETLVGEHLPDSLAMLHLVPPAARIVDVGAGGGLPALPFALLRPDASLTLVEPRAKRAAFLRTAVRELGLPRVEVHAVRVESLGPDTRAFDVATSRATFPPPEWLRFGLGLVRPGGRVLVFAAAPLFTEAARLVDEIRYNTYRGHARWAGAYCFT